VKKTKSGLGFWPSVGCAILVVLSGYICVRIEVYNAAVGGWLPRRANADGWIPKWRTLSEVVFRKAMEKEFRAQWEEAGNDPQEFRTTTEQQRQIEQSQRNVRTRNSFRNFIGTFGLSQYVLAPAAMIWAIVIATRRHYALRWRMSGALLACVAVICVGLMLYRDYIRSLGL